MCTADDVDAIRNLYYRYAETMDAGDNEAFAQLFSRATFLVTGTPFVRQGSAEVADSKGGVLVYPEGVCTSHVIANVIVEIAPSGEVATGRATGVLFQARPGFPLQCCEVATYRDEFARVDGAWHFTEHIVTTQLLGDTSHYLREEPNRILRASVPVGRGGTAVLGT